MAIEAPYHSASLHDKAQKNFKAARPWAALVPNGAALAHVCYPTPLRGLPVGVESQQR